jgi:hypothetical protein
VSLDLAVWEGPRPRNDREAARALDEWMRFLERDEGVEATPAIGAFMHDLLARFPMTEDEDGPWAMGPVPGDVAGGIAYLTMTFSAPEELCELIPVLAARHGLVCYDPQAERLL